MIPNKREFLARRMRDAGLLALAERLARRPGLLVLTYHRIGDPAGQPYYGPVSSATAEALGAELLALRQTHRVVSAEDVAAMAGAGFRVDAPSALVTFDDGYRDNFEAALPVLKAAGVPAVFFLPTDFLQAPRLPWWDHVAYVIHNTAAPLLRLDWPEPIAVDLRQTPRAEAVARVVRLYLDHHVSDEPRFRAELEDRAGVVVDRAGVGRDLFLTWDQARALVAAGMSIGSHSVTHRDLARLPEDEQLAELVESRRVLQAEVGRAVTTLAYPYGWPGAFDEVTRRLAREAGYVVAFSSLAGINRPGKTDPHAVRRLGVGFADSPLLHRARWALYGASGRSFL